MQQKNDSQVSNAYNYLIQAITSFSLAPGTRLSDYKLAQEIQVSRSSVREAIMRIQGEGLIIKDDNNKLIVAPIRIEDVEDVLHVRLGLGSECLRIIAERGWLTKEEESELKAIHAKMKTSCKAGKYEEQFVLDDLFHSKLTDFSRSPRIKIVLMTMSMQMQRARYLFISNPDRMRDTITEHNVLLNAILAHDEGESIRCLKEHLDCSRLAIADVLNRQSIMALATSADIEK